MKTPPAHIERPQRTVFFQSFMDRVKAYIAGERREFTLYVHFPCFDGLVSGALVTRFLSGQNRRVSDILPVNYNLRTTWSASELQKPAAVVDFLYHPDAVFWADHHSTAFVESAPPTQSDDAMILYDPRESSCAKLLWKSLWRYSDFRQFEELRHWADKIDSARYADAREAVLGDHPALRINFGLPFAPPEECSELVRALTDTHSLDKVAEFPAVRWRYDRAKGDIKAGLRVFQKCSWLDDAIVLFDVDSSGVLVNRYAPYYFYPEAKYSVGITRSTKHVRITAMRNPWRNFDSVHLGRIFEQYGGGGHQRVAAVVLENVSVDASSLLQTIVAEIRQQQASPAVISNQGIFA